MRALPTVVCTVGIVAALFVPLFLLLALPRIGERVHAVGPLVALIVLGLVVVVQLGGVPWYFGSHLGLDNGIG
jgi:hypothetical protein